MRDYAATLGPIIQSLPGECRIAIEHEDVQTAAVTLLHCELGYKGSSSEMQQLL